MNRSLLCGTCILIYKIKDYSGIFRYNTAHDIDISIREIEIFIENLSAFLQGTLNPKKIIDVAYLNQYQNMLEPTIKNIAQIADANMSTYYYSNPDLVHKLFSVWYVDDNGKRNFVKHALARVAEVLNEKVSKFRI